ncbi:stage II sporulation protein M [Clostridium sp. MT-14]|uniref:Stage II sporulation protein M n=1 Tax=Clostridium aromativorans TaxID=2836848 RepID=A0ABS8N2P5_9CLOT|nr:MULTISPECIES: stage II sporulation protein M [Clostridium]KAA8674869.1 stage II sporulation protein M [Clostridium sp. HV4-5-A1G]MCC9294069.1 stage II sporulation protein M [Clostridium aromativorans]CAB1243054.1 Stage II sporulation protein M (SpoIIM) [Clostridiaceae bacterium BL-3]
MLENKVSGLINRHIKNNFWLYVISLLCIFTGIVMGIYSVRYMGGFEKSDLVSYLKNFATAVNSGDLNYKSILLQTLKNNIPVILAIWFLGLTMIGIPIILIIDIIKGFTIGFTISFIISQLGIKGMWISLLGVLPQNIIYIPCIILSSVLAMEFSLMIFKDRARLQWKSHILVSITSYSMSFLMVSMVMCVGFFMEAYLTPNMVKLVVASFEGILL